MTDRGIKELSLSFAKPGSTLSPITATVMIQDPETRSVDFYADLDEHQLASLLSGTVIKVANGVG